MKKLSSVLLAALMGASILLPVAGCKKKCKHDVGTWEITTPATCEAEGAREGICGKCLKTVKETLAKDPDNHPYGEWGFSPMPTETEGGVAVKTCSANGEHTLKVNLPALSSVEYESQITVRPTAGKDGERSYTFYYDGGEIQFNRPVPATGIQSLLDAVELGSSAESHALIRSASGYMGTQFLRAWEDKGSPLTEAYGANGFVTALTSGATMAGSTDFTYGDNKYANKLTIEDGYQEGGFSVNGKVLKESFEGTADTVALSTVCFYVYNAGDAAYSYKLYEGMTGNRTESGYEGSLPAKAWTKISITKKMWQEAANDPSGEYVKGNAAEVTFYTASSGAQVFYLDGFHDLVLSTNHAHGYEFGNNYTHIVDGTDECERWYFKEGEELYGLTDFSDGTTSGVVRNDLDSSTGNEKYVDGSRLYLQYANGLGSFYGLESLLEGLYRTARWSDNDDFEEWTEQKSGETVYNFSFGSVENSGNTSGYFAKIKVSFTLNDTFTIDSLFAEASVYVNNSAGGSLKTWDLNENGKAYVIEGKESGTRYYSTVAFTQREKAAGDVVPTNPHAVEDIFVSSFDIKDYDEVVGPNDYVEFASGAEVNTGYRFSIANVQPQGVLENYAMDNFTFYLRTRENGQTVDKQITESTLTSVGMTVHMQPDTHKFFLRAQRAGEQTVVVKTRNAEKVLRCRIQEGAPTKLYPTYYLYQNGEYDWEYTSTSQVDRDHYVYQPLFFTADVPSNEKNFASAGYIFEIKKDDTQPVDESWIVKTSRDTRAVVQFTPEETGYYYIRLTSKVDESVKALIILRVGERPTFVEVASMDYEQRLEYPTVTSLNVTFSDRQETTAQQGGKTVVTGYTMKARIALADGNEQTLACTYELETREMTSTHLSGNEDLGFVLSLNEANKFILSHYVEDFEEWERVELIPLANSFVTLTNKSYEQRLSYPQTTAVNVAFTDRQETTVESNGQTVVTGYTVKAVVTLANGETQTLACEYSIAAQTLNSTHLAGKEELGFALTMDESGRLVLSHPKAVGQEKVTLLTSFVSLTEGEYEEQLKTPYITVAKVTFTDLMQTATGYTATATVTLSGGEYQTLTCTYTAETLSLTSAPLAGDGTLGFSLSLDSAHQLLLTQGGVRVTLLEKGV